MHMQRIGLLKPRYRLAWLVRSIMDRIEQAKKELNEQKGSSY